VPFNLRTRGAHANDRGCIAEPARLAIGQSRSTNIGTSIRAEGNSKLASISESKRVEVPCKHLPPPVSFSLALILNRSRTQEVSAAAETRALFRHESGQSRLGCKLRSVPAIRKIAYAGSIRVGSVYCSV